MRLLCIPGLGVLVRTSSRPFPRQDASQPSHVDAEAVFASAAGGAAPAQP